MSIRRQLSIVLVLPVVGGCSLIGSAASPPQPQAQSQSPTVSQKRGVVTVAEAKGVLARWDRTEKQVLRRGGADWSAAEAGLAAEIHRAEVRMDRLQGEKSKVEQARIVKSRFAIPRAGSGTPWFVAQFMRAERNAWFQVVFAKTRAGWRMVAKSLSLDRPVVAKDQDGFAAVLGPDEKAKLTLSPRQLAQTHARLLESGGDDPRAQRLIVQNLWTVYADFRKQEREELPSRWDLRRDTRPAPDLYALRTTSGGALVWYGVTENDTYVARSGAKAMRFPDGGFGDELSRGKAFREQALYKRASMYYAVVPKSPGKVKVMDGSYAYVSVTGA
jgi:hypothetical protein